MVTTHGGTVQQIQQEVNSDETVANTYLTAAETQVDNAVGEITENLTSANANMEDAVSGVDQAHTDLTSFSTNFMKAVMDLKKERQRKFDKVSVDSSRFMQQIIDQVFRPQLQMIENVKGGAAGATAAAESSLARTRRAFESAMQQDHFKLMKPVEDGRRDGLQGPRAEPRRGHQHRAERDAAIRGRAAGGYERGRGLRGRADRGGAEAA